MLERFLILVFLAALIAGCWLMLYIWQRRRLRALAEVQPLVGVVPIGRPAIVAFTLPSCNECRARQAPALERLRTQLGAAAFVTTLSAEEYPELVTQIGVLTVPATLVLDVLGSIRFLNQGFADESRLRQQLESLDA